jgi:DNA repair exonuclease SbcCD ATPase subunit
LLVLFSFSFVYIAPKSWCLWDLVCGCQELERRAHDKYGAFDRVNAEVHQLRERCSAFDALADALGTPDGWLAYRAMAWCDELPESSGQDAVRRSSLERIRAALVDRDEALWNARADLEKTRTLAANWEAEVATARAETRELRTSLEGAQAQHRQAEERARGLEQRAKEADDLKAALDAKAAALVVAEERLLQESAARQGAEERLQQGQAALVDARAALERERAAHEVTRKSLEERSTALSKVEDEALVLSISNANQELALREQGETVQRLELSVEAVRRDFEMERKQVEGEPLFDSCLLVFRLGTRIPFF